eukprot:scaffold230606_cov31-Prasinocladus_malaysianus.AAC.1
MMCVIESHHAGDLIVDVSTLDTHIGTRTRIKLHEVQNRKKDPNDRIRPAEQWAEDPSAREIWPQ